MVQINVIDKQINVKFNSPTWIKLTGIGVRADWFARNQDIMSKWSIMSVCGLLFQWDSILKIQLQACWSSTKLTKTNHLLNLFRYHFYLMSKIRLYIQALCSSFIEFETPMATNCAPFSVDFVNIFLEVDVVQMFLEGNKKILVPCFYFTFRL